MTRRSLVVVAAGLGKPSTTRLLADRLSDAAVAVLRSGGTEVDVTVIELREHARELADTLVTGFAPPSLQASIDAVSAADALIVVSPVFAGSYSGLFKTFFDVLDPVALDGKPVLIAATGGSVRHSLVTEHALRPLFSYLRAVVVPTAVFAATEDFGAAAGTGLTDRILRSAGQLAALLTPAAPADPAAPAPVEEAPEEDVPAFADLLATVAAGGTVQALRW